MYQTWFYEINNNEVYCLFRFLETLFFRNALCERTLFLRIGVCGVRRLEFLFLAGVCILGVRFLWIGVRGVRL